MRRGPSRRGSMQRDALDARGEGFGAGAERVIWGGGLAGVAVVVRVAAASLRQPTTDHVADREQRHVKPDLVSGEVVGATFLALDGVAGDQETDNHGEVREELRRLKRGLGLGAQTTNAATRRGVILELSRAGARGCMSAH